MERGSVRQWFRRGVSLTCVLVMAGVGTVAMAQGPATPPPGQAQAPANAPALAPQQLDNLVAPIALYPDPLLGQVLAASTYPVELVEAQQWLQANNNLQGQQLMDAARQQNWDASVQALVAMPDVLSRLTQDIQWTTDLGNAFLAQQADVMHAVQRLRARAQANGKLRSTPQETVTTEDQGDQSAIEIQPANPQVIYAPSYDPAYVWGPPAWGYYPPLFYPSYGYWFGPGIDLGLCFGGWGGWGWGPNWFGGGLFINAGFFNRYGFHGYGFGGGFGGRSAWMHDPAHRMGVAYSNSRLNSRYGAASQASRMAAGRSGNWQRFGAGNAGTRSSLGGGTARTGARSFQGGQGSSGWQHFQGRQSYPGSAQSYRGSAQSYRAPAQSYRGSAQGYRAPAQRSYQSAPRMSVPSYRGGGGSSRSYGGGGGGSRSYSGGGARGSGSGGGSHSSGGGGGHSRR